MSEDTLPLFPLEDWKKYRIRGRGWGARSLRKPGPMVTICEVCSAAYYPYHKGQLGCSSQCSLTIIFWKHTEKTETCWLWRGNKIPEGYGYIGTRDHGHASAHRFSYELHKGAIPDGLVIDHLCRTPACVNPDHLEAVSFHENILRGRSHVALNILKTHCKHGHPFDEANTYWQDTRKGRERVCRACKLAYYYRSKAKKQQRE